VYLITWRGCGTVVTAYRDARSLVPFEATCPGCGGSRFRDVDSGERVRPR
jgi:hypothetical protein